jgi:hypothetical protein
MPISGNYDVYSLMRRAKWFFPYQLREKLFTSHPLLLIVGVPPAVFTQFDPGYTSGSSMVAAPGWASARSVTARKWQ